MRSITRQLGSALVCVSILLASGVTARGQAEPPAEGAAIEPIRLELAWELGGGVFGVFEGVDVDLLAGEVYAAYGWSGLRDGWEIGVVRLDRRGKEIARLRGGPFKQGSHGDFRLANLDGRPGPEMLVAGPWSDAVNAFDAQGKPLWSYVRADGVDDIWSADLDGDGRDEVIIGYNGKGGVRVLGSEGTLRWQSTIVGNVWSVTAAPIGPEGAMQVFAPGRGLEMLQTFTAGGEALEPFILGKVKAGLFGPLGGLDPYWVRVSNAGKEPVVIVSDGRGKTILCVDRRGTVRWRRTFAGGTVSDLMASPDRPWFGVALEQRVALHDVLTGDRLASIDGADAQKIAWVAAGGDDPPLLVVEDRGGLKAFAVRGSAPPPKPAPFDHGALGLPAPDSARGEPVAWFADRYIYASDLEGADLRGRIARPLLIEFKKEQKIEATEAQIESFNRWLARQQAKEGAATTGAVEFARASVARATVETWLLNKALYERYGGVVIFQQSNPMEAIGAMRVFLEEHEASGTFRILDAEHKELFWSYYTREHPMQVPKERIDFSRAWWEQER